MDNMIQNYLAAFDELNILASFRFRNTDKKEKKRAEIIIEDLLSFLILAYEAGIRDVSKMLKSNIKPDISKMHKAVYQKIDGKDFTDRARDHINNDDETALIELVLDEYHRVYETSKHDGAKAVEKAKQDGAVKKTWFTVDDDKVRDTHVFLEGVTVGIDDRFYTYDGDSAAYPGDFARAQNNCGCRCIAVYHT